MMADTVNQKDIVYVISQVKDHIQTMAYSNSPAYKWLDETMSIHDILEAMELNGIDNKEDAIKYLLDIAHLFGKDR